MDDVNTPEVTVLGAIHRLGLHLTEAGKTLHQLRARLVVECPAPIVWPLEEDYRNVAVAQIEQVRELIAGLGDLAELRELLSDSEPS